MRGLIVIAFAGFIAGCCHCPSAPLMSAAAPAVPVAPLAEGTVATDDRPTGAMFDLKPGVWEIFKEYRGKLTAKSNEYFATASDGAWAWKETEAGALTQCQEHSTGPQCIIFAHNAKILVPYRLR
jgi:hypothetical protein